jgi:MFS family permease
MLSAPLWVLGWILIALSQTYEMVLCGRVLTGFCVGLVTPSAAVYVSRNFAISSYFVQVHFYYWLHAAGSRVVEALRYNLAGHGIIPDGVIGIFH